MRLWAQKGVNWGKCLLRQATKLSTAISPRRVKKVRKVSWRTEIRGQKGVISSRSHTWYLKWFVLQLDSNRLSSCSLLTKYPWVTKIRKEKIKWKKTYGPLIYQAKEVMCFPLPSHLVENAENHRHEKSPWFWSLRERDREGWKNFHGILEWKWKKKCSKDRACSLGWLTK